MHAAGARDAALLPALQHGLLSSRLARRPRPRRHGPLPLILTLILTLTLTLTLTLNLTLALTLTLTLTLALTPILTRHGPLPLCTLL